MLDDNSLCVYVCMFVFIEYMHTDDYRSFIRLLIGNSSTSAAHLDKYRYNCGCSHSDDKSLFTMITEQTNCTCLHLALDLSRRK